MKHTSTSGLSHNIWKLYLFHALRGLAFFVPVIVLFWQDNGLSLTQIMILQSLYSIAVVLLEIPSGYFADIFGRKQSLIISALFSFVGILTYALGSNFYQFLVAEVLWAVAMAFASGADSALIYDTLKDLNQTKLYQKVIGKAMFYALLAQSAASIVGGVLGKINLRWNFLAMLPFLAILVLLSFSLVEPQRHKQIIKQDYLPHLLQILKHIVKQPKLRWLIIYSAVIVGFNQPAWLLYQPYFKLSGLDVAYFGVVFALFNLVAGFTSKYAHWLETKLGARFSLIMLILLVSLSYWWMANFVYLFSFSFAFMQQFVRGFSKVVITDYINQLVGSDIRATVLSAQSLVNRLVYAAIVPMIGWTADVYSLTQAMMIISITALVIGGVSLILLHRSQVI